MNNLDKLHQVHLAIADDLHRICSKFDIQYFLAAGSMLGAIRHQGFSPWDDDFDVGMTRDNYEKFLKVIESELSDNFYFLSLENNQKYALRYIKLMKRHTKLIEAAAPKDIDNYGIFIDVFVYDKIPKNKASQLRHNLSVEIYQKLLYAKCNSQIVFSNKSFKAIIYNALKLLVIPISKNRLQRGLKRNMIRYNKQDSDYITNVGEYFSNYNNEKVKIEVAKDLKLYAFENREYFGFKDYEAYLTGLYEDWRKPPLEKDSIMHHNYLYLNIDTKNNG